MPQIRSLLLLLAAVFSTGLPSQAQSWDPTADFSTNNPSGVWSYGYSDNLGGDFQLSTVYVSDARYAAWGATSGGPFIVKNTTSTTQHDGNRSHATNQLNLDPSFDGRNAILRFTPPDSGYRVFGRFVGLDNTTTDVGIERGGGRTQDIINGKGDFVAFDFIFDGLLGESIDFVVGPGTGGSLYDGTGLELTIERIEIAACAPAPEGLAVWLPGDGRALDVAGTNQVALLQGAGYDDGVVKEAFSLVGQGNYLAVSDSPSVRPADKITLEGWFRFNDLNRGSIQALAGKTVGSGFHNSYTLFYLNGSLNGVVGNLNTISAPVTIPFRPKVGAWNHLAFTFNDELNTQSLYVNGRLAGVASTDVSIGYDDHPLLLGAEYENAQLDYYFSGFIDEFSLYARDLSEPELTVIYKSGAEGKCSIAPVMPSTAIVRNIHGRANIYAAGYQQAAAGDGFTPALYEFEPAQGQVLTIFKVDGSVSLSGNGLPFYSADGGPGVPPTDITGINGLSGIKSPVTGMLVGVFLDINPAEDPAPATLDFGPAGLGSDFATLSPLIGQVFFIGDGQRADGSPQKFNVPPGASRLFLGIADGWNGSCVCGPPQGYIDNAGAFQASFAISGQDDPCLTAPSGLVSLWKGDGDPADWAMGNHGQLEGGVTFVNGVYGFPAQAFHFDGHDDAVVITSNSFLQPTNITVEAWVNFDALDSTAAQPGLQYLVFKQNSRTLGFEGYTLLKLRDGGMDKLAFALTSAEGVPLGVTWGPVQAGRWYHVAGTYDGAHARLYVDGLEVASQAGTIQMDPFSTPLYLGTSGFPQFDGRLHGALDEVGLYNRALSAEEIQSIILAREYRCYSVHVEPPLLPLPAFDGFSYSTVSPIRSSSPWRFTAVLSSTVSDLRVRVQSTATPSNESSWEFLAGTAARLDSNWTLNTTDVPTGHRYFRAIALAPGYLDRVTETQAIIGPIAVLEGIAPFGDFSYQTTSPLRTGTEWIFSIGQPSLISDFRLRLQSSPTWNVEGSWRDLPEGGRMGRLDSKWTHRTTDLPLGLNFFRVIASAPNYADRISEVLGPLTIGAALAVHNVVVPGPGSYSLKSLPTFEETRLILVKYYGEEGVFYVMESSERDWIINMILAFDAEQNGAISLTVKPGDSLTTPAINIGQNAQLVLGGTIHGSVSLIPNNFIGQNGSTLIGNDGSTLIGNDGSTLIGMDHATLQAIRSSGALNPSSAPLIGNDGAGIISQNGLNLAGDVGNTFLPTGFASGDGSVSRMAIADPVFTGVMTINGDYRQEAGTGMSIAIRGTNTLSTGAQEYDQLSVSGRADLGGVIGFGLFNPSDLSLATGLYQPALGATFDVVVAGSIVTHDLMVRGPIWGDGLHFNWSVVNRADGKQALRLVAARVAPFLAIQRNGAGWDIAYPTNFTGYIIQKSSTLSAPNWTLYSVSTNRVQTGTTGSAGFFRMLKQ